MTFSRVLVANRGEVAVRVIRALHELGIEAVAVFSTADEDAPFVRMADRALRIGPPPASESYLRIASRAAILSPIVRITPAGGPTKTRSLSTHASTNAGLSARKPYPGCNASQPVVTAAATIDGMRR